MSLPPPNKCCCVEGLDSAPSAVETKCRGLCHCISIFFPIILNWGSTDSYVTIAAREISRTITQECLLILFPSYC